MNTKLHKLSEFHLSLLFTFLIGTIFAITRLWRLSTIPSGFHVDEASMAYSAWCLSQYGVDRYLCSWPVYLMNFGGGQSVLYAYLLAGLFKIFGFHYILIRIPSVIFSLFNLIFGMGIIRMIYPEHKYAPYISGILIAICPYFIMAGRLGLDCNLMLGCSTIFLYCFLKAITSEKKRWYFAAGVSGGILLYSYALSYVMLPVFLLSAFVYTIVVRRFSFPKWLLMAVPMGILAFPLILEQIVNIFDLEPFQLGIFTITKMEHNRASEFTLFRLEYLKAAIQNLFVGDTLPYNSIPGFPNLYWLSVPLALAGLIGAFRTFLSSVRRRTLSPVSLLLFWFLIVFLVICHVIPGIGRMNGIFFTYVFLVTEGILLLKKLKKPAAQFVSVTIAVLFLFGFTRFFSYYYTGKYTADTYPLPYFDVCVTEAVDFIEANPQYGPKGAQMAEVPVFLGLSMLRPPAELRLFDQDLYVLDYYHCSNLGLIEDGYYYIVRSNFKEYAEQLRAEGFTEIAYTGYSLFYRE